jgi:putative acetyltransferase
LSRADEQDRLFDIWHDAVRATHGFLAEKDFQYYAGLVRGDMLPAGGFWVAADREDRPLGFLHLEGEKVEALFVDPAHHRKGIGRALMDHALKLSGTLELDANEQSGAVDYYRGLGFREVGRSELDGAGRPYPLVHMRLG